MPEGIITTVEDGYATIDFVDPSLRGPGLQKVIDKYGPEVIETLTRSGPRRMYRVPEGNAIEAGLIDSPHAHVHQAPVTYDDGKPDMDWHRDAIDAYAVSVGVESPSKLPNKQAVLDAIRSLA